MIELMVIMKNLTRCFAFKLAPLFLLFALHACGDEWIPTGGWQGQNKIEGCEAIDLEKALNASHVRPGEQAAITKKFFERCDKDLSREERNAYHQLFQFEKIRYDYQKLRAAEKIEFLDSDGNLTRMTLYMKPGNAVRPLVIIKCGLQCDPQSTTLGVNLMHLFDEGPFHVLLTPSVTGPTYQKDNGIIALGGYDEGRQLFRLAQWVKSSGFKYANRVQEVHVSGMSLGGGSALFAALYASHNLDPQGQPYIKSVFAGCPVVDVRKSVEGIYGGGMLSKLFKFNFWTQMKEVVNSVPILKELFGDADLEDKKNLLEIPEIISRGALAYYKRATRNANFNLAPFHNERISSADDFWKLNRFQDVAHLVKIPVFIWAADNDKVVNSFDNTDLLKNQDPKIYSAIRTKKGNHCMFADSFTWKIVGGVLRSTFLAHSESLKQRTRTQILPVAYDRIVTDSGKHDWFKADSSRRQRVLQWRALPKQNRAQLIAYGKTRCPQLGKDCESGFSIRNVQFSKILLSEKEVPQNEVEAQALTRYLNSNVWIWGQRAGRIEANEEPKIFEIKTLTGDQKI